ncbi:hypothetical protein LF63_0113240 [Oleiagrimonas soli]|nr:hypothetical protein LF63_0113240 [Oleiagrimonas soli]
MMQAVKQVVELVSKHDITPAGPFFLPGDDANGRSITLRTPPPPPPAISHAEVSAILGDAPESCDTPPPPKDTSQQLVDSVVQGLATYLGQAGGAESKPKKLAPMLAQHIEKHLANLKRGGVSKASMGSARFALDLLLDLTGDKPIVEVTTGDVDAFLDVLAALPPRALSRPEFQHMRLKNIVDKAKAQGDEPISKGTQHKYILYLKAFFHWCIESGDLEADPTRQIQSERYISPTGSSKEAFSRADLDALFCPKAMAKLKRPQFYWAPLIAFYTGMRVNEIAQLYVADIDRVGKTPCFSIAPYRDGQHLKSANAERHMPIHPKLIELGFMDYVADVKAAGCKHLFPGLNWSGPGPGSSISEWFGRYRKKQGVLGETKTFHCFRHSLATMADRSGVSETVITKMLGHSRGASVARRHYIQRADVNECAENLGRIEFPELVLQPYQKGRFDTYLARADKAAERRQMKREKPKKEKAA